MKSETSRREEAETRGHCCVDTLARGSAAIIFGQIYNEDCIGGFTTGNELCAPIMDEYVTNLRAEYSLRLGSEAIIGDWFDVDRLEGLARLGYQIGKNCSR